MKRVLILLTSSFPFGRGETFLANEIPYLAEVFHRIIIISNDLESEQEYTLPDGVQYLRMGYSLSLVERMLSLTGLLHPEVWRELRRVRRMQGVRLSRLTLSTILTSWFKAQKFGQLIRRLAPEDTESGTVAYSYWANDMALAVALARKNEWVEVGLCRAHGWDVYPARSETGFLPFRTFLANHLDHYLIVSEDGVNSLRDQLEEGEFASPGVSRLGVPAISPEPLGRKHPFTILSCSRLIALKRVDQIARSLALFPHDVRWVHVGDGPNRGEVEEACRDMPRHVQMEFLGQLPHIEIPGLYRRFRPTLLLNLSAWEGLPVAMMEAMAAGVPVVGTDVGGVSEIIRHRENGLLLPPDPTSEEVAEALEWMHALSEDAYGSYAFQARETWRTEFDADKNYPAFLETITE